MVGKVGEKMLASTPADAGRGTAGLGRILPPQGGNAPLRRRRGAASSPYRGAFCVRRERGRVCARSRGRCLHRALRMRGGALPGLEGYFRRKAAMHPSGGALGAACSPCRGAFCARLLCEAGTGDGFTPGPEGDACIDPCGCRAGCCRAWKGSAALRRQCTPQAAPWTPPAPLAGEPFVRAFCVRRADGGNGSGDRRLCACEMRGRGLLGKEEPFKELIVY